MSSHHCVLTLENRRGLHARAAAKFVTEARKYTAQIDVECNGAHASAASIMGLLMLTASLGSTLRLTATGDDARVALDALQRLVQNKFEEE